MLPVHHPFLEIDEFGRTFLSVVYRVELFFIFSMKNMLNNIIYVMYTIYIIVTEIKLFRIIFSSNTITTIYFLYTKQ